MYNQPSKNNWFGRIDSETDILSFRFHQQVQLVDLPSVTHSFDVKKTFGLIGFQCDEGVRRNQGRRGAAKAPDAVRQAIGKLPWHLPGNAQVLDIGDIECLGDRMEEAQAELGKAVSSLLNNKICPIIIGGGHETFYGHYLGAREFMGPAARLGIINIDAHFDMRPYDQESSSGTMFKQILDQDQNCGYLCLGIQKLGNTAALFETAENYNVKYVMEENLASSDIAKAFNEVDSFASQYDATILTLCTDVIGSAYAPGVSAPAPFGLDPKVVRLLIQHIASKDKTLSFDVCEVNPDLDENKKTVTLAAHLINTALMNFEYSRGG
ncbi:formimidoylglutamase [Mesobacillus zeae]|uniref:Formimidoylglutamase n=1 Tax=Mesobacillus zeae TaxID=1917180 RepID=A0A398BC52_9BACI|nr:formimidoylglutamase [Mesobacillus zeae]RID87749.1 formimidoylglutamase [Mesobacillus zeae]